jgi:Spy/CpxP family protein refolding chaperone
MTGRTITICALALAATVAPLAGQEPGERLERLRMERLRSQLELDEGQAQAVQEAMEEVRRAHHESMEREREAFERIRQALRSEPVDQQSIAAALDAIEHEREALVEARRQESERLKQRLTPEQRAKLLIFNRMFEERARELMAQRRGGPGHGFRQGPGMRGPRMRGPRGPRPGEDAGPPPPPSDQP